jgi:hypothetical protein
MILALLAGRKLQTRRLLPNSGKLIDFRRTDAGEWEFTYHGYPGKEMAKPPRIRTGDRLYVREAWKTFVSLNTVAPRDLWSKGGGRGAGITYLADNMGMAITREGQRTTGERDIDASAFGRYRPGMHMPKWASRMTLIVDDVRIERLQDISEADAIAEGIEPVYDERGPGETYWKDYSVMPDGMPHPWTVVPFISPVRSYESLWTSINGEGSWGANPWVSVYVFEVRHANIDSLGERR